MIGNYFFFHKEGIENDHKFDLFVKERTSVTIYVKKRKVILKMWGK